MKVTVNQGHSLPYKDIWYHQGQSFEVASLAELGPHADSVTAEVIPTAPEEATSPIKGQKVTNTSPKET